MTATIIPLHRGAIQRPEPPRQFGTAAAAWLWCYDMVGDPTADAIRQAVDLLYRQRRIGLHHVRVMRIYGEAGHPPHNNGAHARPWREAMAQLTAALRVRGVLA